MRLSPDHWTTFIDVMRSGAVQRLRCISVDFSELTDDVFLIAVGFRGLQALVVHHSVVPGGFVTDDLIRSSVTKGVLELDSGNNESDAPSRLSEEAILDYFFRSDTAPGGQAFELRIDGTEVTDMFLSKFFERLRSRPVRDGSQLYFLDVPTQRRLSAYAEYLESTSGYLADAVYRFPWIGDGDNSYYEVILYERSDYMYACVIQVR